MLILSLTAVSRGEVRIDGEISPDDPIWEDADLALSEPLRAELGARSVSEGILVRGRIGTRLEMECRRCLTPVNQEIEDEVDLLYEPLTGTEEEAELGGEVYPLPPRGDQVDLRPALREQLLLRVPDHVLCSDECRGLCPKCGADLNRGSCECTPEASPSAWEALKQLKFE